MHQAKDAQCYHTTTSTISSLHVGNNIQLQTFSNRQLSYQEVVVSDGTGTALTAESTRHYRRDVSWLIQAALLVVEVVALTAAVAAAEIAGRARLVKLSATAVAAVALTPAAGSRLVTEGWGSAGAKGPFSAITVAELAAVYHPV